MDNWRTFIDYEAQFVDEQTGEITWKIIGEGRAKREYNILKNQKRIVYNGKIKRIIYRCEPSKQLRLW